MFGCESWEIVLASRSKRCAHVRSAEQVRRQHLDRDVAPEPRVAGAIDLAHPARAERRQDLVGTEFRPGRERHAEIPSVRGARSLREVTERRSLTPRERSRSVGIRRPVEAGSPSWTPVAQSEIPTQASATVSHAAGTDRGDDLIRTQSGAGDKRHGVRWRF